MKPEVVTGWGHAYEDCLGFRDSSHGELVCEAYAKCWDGFLNERKGENVKFYHNNFLSLSKCWTLKLSFLSDTTLYPKDTYMCLSPFHLSEDPSSFIIGGLWVEASRGQMVRHTGGDKGHPEDDYG